MAGHRILLLGAGFSKPLGGPLLSELLDEAALARSPADAEALEAVRHLASGADGAATPVDGSLTIEEVFTSLWRTRRVGGAVAVDGRLWPAADLYHQLEVHLSGLCGAIDVDTNADVTRRYVRFIQDAHATATTLTVVSFNYDLVVERCLDLAGVGFDHGDLSQVTFADAGRRRRLSENAAQVPVLKLHGSANWGVCRGGHGGVVAFEAPYVPHDPRPCPVCGDGRLDAGVVPPVTVKVAPDPHLSAAWHAARAAFRRADELISIGYSLPEGDAEAVGLLEDALHHGRLRALTTVCGPRGAPPTYRLLFPDQLADFGGYFEDFLDAHVAEEA